MGKGDSNSKEEERCASAGFENGANLGAREYGLQLRPGKGKGMLLWSF